MEPPVVATPSYDGYKGTAAAPSPETSPSPIVIVQAKAGITSAHAFRTALCEAADDMASIVTPCLGPDGVMRATVDMVGNVGFTSSGAVLLRKARDEHPLSHYLLRTLEAYSSRRGDCSIRWALLMQRILHLLRDPPGHGAAHPHTLHALSKAIPRIAAEALRPHSRALTPQQICTACITASVTTCCTGGVQQAMLRLLQEYTLPLAASEPGRAFLQHTPPEGHFVKTVLGAPFSKSSCLAGWLFDASPARHPEMPRGVRGARVVLLKGRPLFGKDGGYDSDSSSGSSSSGDGGPGGRKRRQPHGGDVSYEMTADELADSQEWMTLSCKIFAASLGNSGIGAVLSCVALPEAAIAEAAVLGILISDTFEPDDIRKLAGLLRVETVEPSAFIQHYTDPSGGHLSEADSAPTEFIETMRAAGGGGQPYIRVVPQQVGSGVGARTLLIAAPSPGVAKDYAFTARRALQAVRHCLGDGGLWVGGCWKDWLVVSSALRRDGALRASRHAAWGEAVASALEGVAAAGLLNTLGDASEGSRQWVFRMVAEAGGGGRGVVSTVHVLAQLEGAVDALLAVADPEAVGQFELASSLPDLLQSCLVGAQQLSRIDALAPSKRLSKADQSQHVSQTHLV